MSTRLRRRTQSQRRALRRSKSCSFMLIRISSAVQLTPVDITSHHSSLSACGFKINTAVSKAELYFLSQPSACHMCSAYSPSLIDQDVVLFFFQYPFPIHYTVLSTRFSSFVPLRAHGICVICFKSSLATFFSLVDNHASTLAICCILHLRMFFGCQIDDLVLTIVHT